MGVDYHPSNHRSALPYLRGQDLNQGPINEKRVYPEGILQQSGVK
jgi:hypothetical protein